MEDRKARLAALAAKAGRNKKTADNEATNQDEAQATEEPTIKFRNYAPADESIEDKSEEPESKRARTEEQKSVLEQALEKTQKEVAAVIAGDEVDVTKMGPKKINADLKRDIQPKLDKLERRTQRVIVALLKEKLEREAEADVPDLD